MSATAAINKANAQHSTGPRTVEGKATVSQNANKHNLTGRLQIREDEKAAFEEFEAQHRHEIEPTGPLEDTIFEQLISAAWNLRRIETMEAEQRQTSPTKQPPKPSTAWPVTAASTNEPSTAPSANSNPYRPAAKSSNASPSPAKSTTPPRRLRPTPQGRLCFRQTHLSPSPRPWKPIYSPPPPGQEEAADEGERVPKPRNRQATSLTTKRNLPVAVRSIRSTYSKSTRIAAPTR